MSILLFEPYSKINFGENWFEALNLKHLELHPLIHVSPHSSTEPLNSAGSAKGSSCRTWSTSCSRTTSSASCWLESVRAPGSRVLRFSSGFWGPRWAKDCTISTQFVGSRNGEVGWAGQRIRLCSRVFFICFTRRWQEATSVHLQRNTTL